MGPTKRLSPNDFIRHAGLQSAFSAFVDGFHFMRRRNFEKGDSIHIAANELVVHQYMVMTNHMSSLDKLMNRVQHQLDRKVGVKLYLVYMDDIQMAVMASSLDPEVLELDLSLLEETKVGRLSPQEREVYLVHGS